MDFDRAEAPDPTMENISMSGFLANLGLDHLLDIFEKEQVCTYLEHICPSTNIYFYGFLIYRALNSYIKMI